MKIFILTETMITEKQIFPKCDISITSKCAQNTEAHKLMADMRGGYAAAWLFNIYISSTDLLSKFSSSFQPKKICQLFINKKILEGEMPHFRMGSAFVWKTLALPSLAGVFPLYH